MMSFWRSKRDVEDRMSASHPVDQDSADKAAELTYTDGRYRRYQSDIANLAVVEACLRKITNAISGARIQSDSPAIEAMISPIQIATAVRRMLISGNCVICMNRGMLEFADDYDVSGRSFDPRKWTYRLTLNSPDTSFTKNVSGQRVLHFRYAEDPRALHRGLPPLALSATTRRLAAALEHQMSQQISQRSIATVAAEANPTGMNFSSAAEFGGLANDFYNADGRTLFSSRELQIQSLNLEMDDSISELRRDIRQDIIAAFGCDGLFAEGEGSGLREAYRSFINSTVYGICRRLEYEIAMKTNATVRIDLSEAKQGEVAALARAFNSFIQAGLSQEDASRIIGVSLDSQSRAVVSIE